jgi:hypothetical protein
MYGDSEGKTTMAYFPKSDAQNSPKNEQHLRLNADRIPYAYQKERPTGALKRTADTVQSAKWNGGGCSVAVQIGNCVLVR